MSVFKKSFKNILLLVSFIFPLIIYLKTLLPYVDFWDTGEFQTIAKTFDFAHPTGYPTYVALGKIFLTIFPFGSVAWRMNLFSAITVSLGLLVIALFIYKITKNMLISILATGLLSINPYLWSVAVRADPHALHFLFLSVFIFLSLKIIETKKIKYLLLISLITGFSLGNQLLSVFFLPALLVIYIYLIKSKIKIKYILMSLIFLATGASIYLLLPILSNIKTPLTSNYSINTLENFKRHVLGEDFKGMMFKWNKGSFKDTLNYYFLLVDNSLPNYLWIMLPVGFILGFFIDPLVNIILTLIFFGILYFAMSYQNAVIDRYYISPFAVGTVWISFVFYYVFKLISKLKIKKYLKKILLVQICILVVLNIGLLIKKNYKIVDQSKNLNAYNWVMETFDSINDDGVIFSWWSYSTPLWYMQKVEGLRKDITIVNASQGEWENMANNFIKDRPVYFIENIKLKNTNYSLVRSGNIYELATGH